MDVLRLVVRGMLNKQIAAELGASEATIKVHRGRVMEKMQVTSVADLIRVAETSGLDGSPSGPYPASPHPGSVPPGPVPAGRRGAMTGAGT
jgi:hypothetical protein